jgi:hypothetical protein
MNKTQILVAGGVFVLVAILSTWSVLGHSRGLNPINPAPQTATTSNPLVAATTSNETTTLPTPVVTHPVTPTATPHAYGVITLALDQVAKFADVTITPTDIIEDSRCPVNAQCIQAGTVRVSVKFTTPAGTNTQTLTLNQPVTVNGVSITLTNAQPGKKVGTTISKSDYRFTFDVQKKLASASCYIGGCSREVCSDNKSQVSSCIYRPEYACYRDATCERQASGACGWTQTSALHACILATEAPL